MTNASPLNYSRNTGADWRKLLLRIVGALVLCAIFAGSLVLACDRFHYWDRDGFRDALESVPGVRVRGIDGFDDGPVWKVVGACVVVGDGGGREIYLRFAEPADLRHGRSLPVSGIGPFDLSASYPDGSWPNRMDFGKEGPFGNMLPKPIRDVEDLVARYDELVRFLEQLPPDGDHRSTDGKLYQYHVRRR